MRLRYNAATPDHPYVSDAATKRKITDGPGESSLNPSWFAFTPDLETQPVGPLTDSIAFAGPDEDGGESRIHYAEYHRQATWPFWEDDKILTSTLTSAPRDDTAPAWSPTGKRIAYQSNRGGRSDIYVMDPASSGTEPGLNLTQSVGDNANPDWEAPVWLQDESFPIRPLGRRARRRRAHVGRAASVTPSGGGVGASGVTGSSGSGGGDGGRVSRECRKTGTAGDDLLCGAPNRDVLRGKGGNDRILGRGGNDILLGGAGKDRILGGPGGTGSAAGRATTACTAVPAQAPGSRPGENLAVLGPVSAPEGQVPSASDLGRRKAPAAG
jgi:hypothetical protein